MEQLSPIQYGIVHCLRSDLTVKSIDFQSFGASRKAVLTAAHGGEEIVVWVRPTDGDSGDVNVVMRLLGGRKPRRQPRTRLVETAQPGDVPDAVTTLVQRVRRARGTHTKA
jgi:hypothetical protein